MLWVYREDSFFFCLGRIWEERLKEVFIYKVMFELRFEGIYLEEKDKWDI